MKNWLALGLGLFLTLAVAVLPAQGHMVPDYDGLVNDFAGIISDTTEQQLEDQLGALATSTEGAEVAVVTIKTLEGDPIEHLAQEFFTSWEIGKASRNNGVLLLIAVDDRAMRIQTGYGAEVVLTDSTAGSIIRNHIAPPFKEGNYDLGVTQGVNKIITYLQDPEQIPRATPEIDESSSEINPELFVFLLYLFFTLGVSGVTYLAAFLGRTKDWWVGGLIGFVLGGLVGQLPGGVAFGLFGLLLDYLLSTNFEKWQLEKRATDWRSTWGGFHTSSSSSSSSSGSGFSSFGGGSSGGGGASGRW